MSLPKKVFPFIFYFARQQWIKISIILLASTAWGMNNALFPYLLKQLINALASCKGDIESFHHPVSKWIFAIMLLFIATNLLLRAQGFVLIRFCSTFRANIREALFQHVQTHASSYFANNFSGTIASKIADVPITCERIFFNICYEFLVAFTGAVIVIFTMWVGHPVFAVLLMAWLTLHFVILFLFFKKGRTLLQSHAEAVTTLSGKIVDVLTNIQSVKLFAWEKYEHRYFHHFQKEEIKKSREAHGHLEWMQVFLVSTNFF